MYEAICKAIFEQYGMEVQEVQSLKGGAIKTGISPTMGDIRPTVYPDQLPEGSPEEIAEAVYKLLTRPIPDMNTGDLLDWEKARERLRLCVRPVTDYPGHVTKKYLDMELYVRVMIDTDKSCVVTESLLDRWGISKQDLFDAAPATAATVEIMELSGFRTIRPDAIDLENVGMIILSNKDHVHGAASVFDTETMDAIAEHNGGHFYVLPSSIHECILMPYSAPVDMLKDMVQTVNRSEVEPEDRLSDSIYLYEDGSLKIAA